MLVTIAPSEERRKGSGLCLIGKEWKLLLHNQLAIFWATDLFPYPE
jgi:hypothetical protein